MEFQCWRLPHKESHAKAQSRKGRRKESLDLNLLFFAPLRFYLITLPTAYTVVRPLPSELSHSARVRPRGRILRCDVLREYRRVRSRRIRRREPSFELLQCRTPPCRSRC